MYHVIIIILSFILILTYEIEEKTRWENRLEIIYYDNHNLYIISTFIKWDCSAQLANK